MRLDRTQRKLGKKATSGLAALALRASLADSETLVNNPAWECHCCLNFASTLIEQVPLAGGY